MNNNNKPRNGNYRRGGKRANNRGRSRGGYRGHHQNKQNNNSRGNGGYRYYKKKSVTNLGGQASISNLNTTNNRKFQNEAQGKGSLKRTLKKFIPVQKHANRSDVSRQASQKFVGISRNGASRHGKNEQNIKMKLDKAMGGVIPVNKGAKAGLGGKRSHPKSRKASGGASAKSASSEGLLGKRAAPVVNETVVEVDDPFIFTGEVLSSDTQSPKPDRVEEPVEVGGSRNGLKSKPGSQKAGMKPALAGLEDPGVRKLLKLKQLVIKKLSSSSLLQHTFLI